MEFSNQQKLIITLLTDIHARLGIDNSVDPLFVQRMVQRGHGWALGWAYPGLFEDGIEPPEAVTFVAEVLTMWEAIEETYAGFDQARKDQLAELAPTFGRDPQFRGFDGSHEADLRGLSISSWMTWAAGRPSGARYRLAQDPGRRLSADAGGVRAHRGLRPRVQAVGRGAGGNTERKNHPEKWHGTGRQRAALGLTLPPCDAAFRTRPRVPRGFFVSGVSIP
ncbi:hypothetical protein ACFSHR_11245 [Azotobacter chroococcum]